MDTCAQVDIINIDLVNILGLEPAAAKAPGLEAADGDPMESLGTYWLTFHLIDSDNRARKLRRLFVACRRPSEAGDLLLSNGSMGDEGIQIDTGNGRWRFGAISKISPEDLVDKLVKDHRKAYILYFRVVAGGARVYAANTREWDGEPPIPTVDDEPDDPGGEIPEELRDLGEVFSADAARELPLLEGAEHSIDLVEGQAPPHGPIYPLSPAQLAELRRYLDENIASGRIRESVSAAGAPILFVPKKDGTLRLCVDYRGLNAITIKNRYPLPLIGDLLDRLAGAQFFSKIDIRDAYHRIRIKESDRWKGAFRTRYGHFEYTVMPFGLTNAPATFQAYIHRALAGLLDIFCIVYLDDIVIYSQNREDHTAHLRQVLERLQRAQLYAKLSKCTFYQHSVEFLGFIVDREGVSMDPARVRAIADWTPPESFRDIQVFLGFANFYRKFIQSYSRITAPLTALLKGSIRGVKHGPFDLPPDALAAFNEIKEAFASATILRHWDPTKESKVETDASNRAVSGILSQLTADQWRPVAYWSRKLTETEERWHTGQQELCAIVEALDHWRHYLEGLDRKFTVLTDHQALKGVVDSPARDLRGRLARWVYRLSAFDFDLQHQAGKKNPADGLSRKPAYMKGEVAYLDLLPTLERKLALAPELPATVRRSIAACKSRPGTVAQAYIQAVQATLDMKCRNHCPCRRRKERLAAGEDSLPSRQEAASRCPLHRAGMATRANVAAVTRARARKTGERPANARRPATAPRVGEIPQGTERAGVTAPEQYIPRSVATQLARRETAYSDLPSDELEQLVRGLQAKDPNCQFLAENVRRAAGKRAGYFVDDSGTLFYKDRLVIPEQNALRQALLQQHHDAPRAGHIGANKTEELLARKFYWEGMSASVRQYVASCPECQGARVPRHRPYGKLQSLPLPSHPFQEISMDFITGLPESSRDNGLVYDAVLVIVDRFTKLALFIPTQKTLNAAGLARILWEEVECRFGTPLGIVGDRDTLFTSQFWREFADHRQITRRLSTAYHPQTDGQTERTHQSLQKFLRTRCVVAPTVWATELPAAEFSYNNSRHSSLGISPFQALMGYNPRMVAYVPGRMKTSVEGVRERLARMEHVREQMAEHWASALRSQAKHYNGRHTPMEYREGQVVGLSTKHFRFKGKGAKKLAPRFIRVVITGRVGSQAYRVQLPAKYSRLHDVFPVSLLEPWTDRRPDAEQTALPELEEELDEWEVEDIVSHKEDGGETYYLVKWAGWPVEYNTWEPVAHLDNAKRFLKAYHAKAKKAHKKWDDEA